MKRNIFKYGFCEEQSKILYSYHKRRIPNSFGGTMFGGTMFQICIFLLSVTDRSESINQDQGCVNLSPIDIKESVFETNGLPFNPPKLDIVCGEKKVVTEAVVKMFKKIADISNSSIVNNTDGLLSKISDDINVAWVGKSKSRLPSDKYIVSF